MSRVAKYRRQVSEDPDIDNLLSTLSPEEMEQLQRELDSGDPDAGISAGLRKDQTEKASSQREAERERFTKQTSADESKSPDKPNAHKKIDMESKRLHTQNSSRMQVSEEKKETKTEVGAPKQEKQKDKDDRVAKMRERFRQEKNNTVEKKTEGSTPNNTSNVKITKTEKERIKDETEKTKPKTENSEKQLEKQEAPDKSIKTKGKQIHKDLNKNVPILKTPNEDDKVVYEDQKTEKNENGTLNQVEEGKEDESSSIFDELLEKVKNNEPEMTELNLNNSDCITIETLMSFTEALEFNTHVKLFSLANTRADDHIALAIAAMLKSNKTIISINLDSNHVTGKGILAIFRALQHNQTLTELRFHNQRHICGGKTEMDIAKMLKENTTLLKLGYHFELAGPRMTVTNLLSRNMDKQRQRRIAEQKAAQAAGDKKNNCLEVPKAITPSPKISPQPSPQISKKGPLKKGGIPAPPPPPLAPPLINENIRSSLSPASQRRIVEKTGPSEKNSRDQLLESIRTSNIKQLKKVEVPKWLK
ncbi:leiomodin-1 [Bombina bombina]|uniref:leiomodin-1 n=1 Tax=Bombina bombina TaxID=8345 RepID=UPI00235AB510|nr:leiomodin-1 [Bombina bombina]